MATPVLSRYVDDDEFLPAADGSLAKDAVPTPPAERRLEAVVHDYAVRAWGDIRGIDQMNSSLAIETIQQAMLDAVAATKGQQAVIERDLGMARRAGKALRALVMRLWSDPSKSGDPSKSSTRICRLCGGTRLQHAPGCAVANGLEVAKRAGFGGES